MAKQPDENRISLSPVILNWAIPVSSRPALQKKFPKLDSWFTGESGPTFKQLQDLAKVVHVPFGYFFLDEPPAEQMPVPLFRSASSTAGNPGPSAELVDTVFLIKRRQEWLSDYLPEYIDPLPFVNSVKLTDDDIVVAHAIRSKLGIESGWAAGIKNWTEALSDLITRVENIGIFVASNGIVGNNVYRTLDPTEFRGFVLVDEYAPFIFINGLDSKSAQMFTIGHELAHIWLGKSAAFDLRDLQPSNDPIELKCDAIAAEVLVPRADLKSYITTTGIVNFDALAATFKVSPIVVARRALDLGLITRDKFFAFYHDYTNREFQSKKQGDGGNFYNTQNQRVGKLFGDTVYGAVRADKLLYRDAFRLTGLTSGTFDTYFEKKRK